MADTCDNPVADVIDDLQSSRNWGYGATPPDYRGTHYVGTFVEEAFAYAAEMGAGGYQASLEFLKQLACSIDDINAAGVDVSFDLGPPPDLQLNIPTVPPIRNVSVPDPNFPDKPPFHDVPDPDFSGIGDVPEFNISDPVIVDPTLPDTTLPTAPGDAPEIDTDFVYPDAEDYITPLPSVPTFEELNIPTAPDIVIPNFDMAFPAIGNLAPPSGDLDWMEEEYLSELLDATQLELLDRIQNGGTYLKPNVEQALWDRARNREDQNATKTENSYLREQAARGFSKPQGSTSAGLAAIQQEAQNKIVSLSRDIAIKQAELEVDNIKHALTSAIQLEQITIAHHDKVMDRSLEAAKFTLQFAIDLYRARVTQYQLEVEAYKAYATAFEIQVRAALAEIEVFKTEIEAQKLISDINNSYVQLYLAQIEGVKSSIGIYVAQIDAIKTKVEAESLVLQAFKTEVDAYSAQVSAKRDEFSMYGEQVKAQQLKVDTYESQVKAFATRVQAYAESVDAETSKTDLHVKILEADIKSYLAELSSITEVTKVQAAIANSNIQAYMAEIDGWKARVGADETRIDAELKEYDANLQKVKAELDIELKNAEINLDNAARAAAMTLDALKSGQASSTGMAQAALGAMSTSASISQGFSWSESHSYQEK